MTRKKLTDEQVQAIERLNKKGASAFVEININQHLAIVVQLVGVVGNLKDYWQVFTPLGDVDKNFETATEAIAYAEDLLNRQYCWLPQQQAWIMSDEVYNFANGGVNKVWELIHLVKKWDDFKIKEWFVAGGKKWSRFPSPPQLAEGITIPADSPIWDAVAGVEVWEGIPPNNP